MKKEGLARSPMIGRVGPSSNGKNLIHVKAPRSLASMSFGLILLVSLYYLSYRYPLQINSSTTSPTYSDTPTSLQVGKYLLVYGIVLFTALTAMLQAQTRPRVQSRTTPLLIILVAMALFGALKGVMTGDFQAAADGALPAVGAVLIALSLNWEIDGWFVSRLLSIFAVIAVGVEAVQLFLFQSQGRLPALAYEDSISVRFGSLLDDPNGFALLLPLLLPVVYLQWKRHPILRAVLLGSLLICLALTQSATGAAATIAAMVIGALALRWRSPGAILVAALAVPLGLFALWQALRASALVTAVWDSKSGSIGARSGSFEQLSELRILDYFGGGNPQAFIELSYISILAHYGILFLIGYITAGMIAIGRLRKMIIRGTASPAHYGFFYFIIAFLIASFNLQLDGIWPLNILYYLGISFSFYVPRTRGANWNVAPTRAAQQQDLRGASRY